MFDEETFRLKIIDEQQRERGLIFYDEDARRAFIGRFTHRGSGTQVVHRSFSRLVRCAGRIFTGDARRARLRPFGWHRLAGDEIDHGFSDIGRVVADPLQVL